MKKLLKLIKKESDSVEKIFVSEEFALELKNKAKYIKIDVRQYRPKDSRSKEEVFDQYFLFDIPMFFSNIITKGAVMEMKNGETIILKTD